jgi:hypothetical protein
MSLTAEQRRALAMLATAGRDGVAQALLSAHGFDASEIAGLVNEGLATQTLSRGRAGGNTPRSFLSGSRPRAGGRLRGRCRRRALKG